MGNVKSAAGWTRDTTLGWWLILLMLHDGTCTSSAIELVFDIDNPNDGGWMMDGMWLIK
jgi:hypothetical protein